MSMWRPTTDGAVNAAYVVRIVRTSDGILLHLTNGHIVRSTLMFEIVEGELVQTIDDDMDVPF